MQQNAFIPTLSHKGHCKAAAFCTTSKISVFFPHFQNDYTNYIVVEKIIHSFLCCNSKENKRQVAEQQKQLNKTYSGLVLHVELFTRVILAPFRG